MKKDVWQNFFNGLDGETKNWLGANSDIRNVQPHHLLEKKLQEDQERFEYSLLITRFCMFLLQLDILEVPDYSNFSDEQFSVLLSGFHEQLIDDHSAKKRYSQESELSFEKFLEHLIMFAKTLSLQEVWLLFEKAELESEVRNLDRSDREISQYEELIDCAKAALQEIDRDEKNKLYIQRLLNEFEPKVI